MPASSQLSEAKARLERLELELRAARVEAAAAHDAKADFVRNLSHELRTPLTAILGFTEQLIEAESGPGEVNRAELLDIVWRNGQHLLQMIQDLLELSTIETGRARARRERFDPRDIVSQVVALFGSIAAGRRLELRTSTADEVPADLCADPTRTRQILISLVDNALRFTEAGSVSIELAFTREPGEEAVWFHVSDTGPGISPEDQERLFEPFEQRENRIRREHGGTGIGLALSRRLADLMEGSLELQSEVGAGSTFSLRLPYQPSSAAETRAVEPAPEIAQEPEDFSYRVLFVEDSVDNQRLLRRILERKGADVTLAANGRIGVDLALASRDAGEPFDLILMDMQMPVLDGYEATAELRAHSWDGPIVALTAHASEDDRARCLRAGCDDYATKPVQKGPLFRLLAAQMKR